MALISFDMGADTSIVSILQLTRLISVIALFPPLVTRVVRLFEKRCPQEANLKSTNEKEKELRPQASMSVKNAVGKKRLLLQWSVVLAE